MSDIYRDSLNNIIAADDLYWNEIEKKYTALSMEELDSILLNCVDQGIHDENDMLKIVSWATNARVGALLLKNFLENKVKITVDEEGETYFNKKIS
jgi:hypothetical protein